jgi:hypothetical protein
LTGSRVFLFATWCFLLLSPAALDYWVGTRVYRNAIIAPGVLLALGCMMNLLLVGLKPARQNRGPRVAVAWSVATGVSFLFFYYIKEDGLWLVPALAATVLTAAIAPTLRVLRARPTRRVLWRTAGTWTAIAALPVAILGGGTAVYKAVNHHYFGVWEVNTRTAGAFGGFVERLNKIDDPNKTLTVWTPVTTIDKAWEVSPTLAEHPDLLDAIRTSPWVQGDIVSHPITGDFIAWVLRDALVTVGLFDSEAEVQSLFTVVNAEIDAAFASGDLPKSSKIFASGYATGRTVEQIVALAPLVKSGLAADVLFATYATGMMTCDDQVPCDLAEFILNQGLRTQSEATSTFAWTQSVEDRLATRCQ